MGRGGSPSRPKDFPVMEGLGSIGRSWKENGTKPFSQKANERSEFYSPIPYSPSPNPLFPYSSSPLFPYLPIPLSTYPSKPLNLK